MDHGKFAEFRAYLRAWIKDHPIEGERTCVVKNPLKKTARGKKRARASQLANAAKKRRDKAGMRSMRDEPVEVTEDPAASPRRAGEDSEARMT